ncbi:hypothetical protein [Sphingobacterium sp. JB170]|nr:hypothetical protein [Sphingobacterium sp. JB170]SJN48933.1 hypothetical protein FM107_17900 [Sphingobacterium sp. JB170]
MSAATCGNPFAAATQRGSRAVSHQQGQTVWELPTTDSFKTIK